jgi:uncharacterized protein (TIGR04255 family)
MAETAHDATSKRTKFENPPINELVVSLFHLPIPELKAQHIGIYWSRVRERYPLCEQQSVVATPSDTQPLITPITGEVFPLPRFWFYSDAHPTLIQVQRNAFMVNWRRLPSLAGREYPHYEMVIADFWRELENYKPFVQEIGGKLDVIQRCELNYVNVIGTNEFFAEPAQVANVLPSLEGFCDLNANERNLAGLAATIAYQVDPNLSIDITIRLGRRSDTNEQALGLELKAYGVPSDLSLEGARGWYDLAHDATYKLFLDATAKQIQNDLWRPR